MLAREYKSHLTVTGERLPPPMTCFIGLVNMGVISKKIGREIDYYRTLRNKLVHGEEDSINTLDKKIIDKIKSITLQIKNLID
ncbi:hypothetical protein ES708_21117 [subsurface metagenome]